MRILDTGTRPGDDPDLVVRKRTAVATAVVAGVASFIYIAIGLNAGVPVVVALATLNLVGQVVNVVVFHFTGRIGPLVTVEMALGLLVIVGGAAAIGGITQGGGTLSPEWRSLFARYSDRFLLGSDTWINERWYSYDTIMKDYRGWLAQLPADQAQRIAHGNAERLFGSRRGE